MIRSRHLIAKVSMGKVRRVFLAVSFAAVFSIVATAPIIAQTPADTGVNETEIRLAKQLASSDSEQKRSALFEIRNLRTESASRLAVPALQDGNEIVRATAASSVVFLPPDEAVTALARFLADKAEFVRREAASALGKVGSPLAAGPLLGLLQKEKILEVRSAAVIALGESGNAAAVEPLNRLLKARPREADEFLRRSAARSIGQIAQIIRTGRREVLTPRNFLPEKYKDQSEAAAKLDAQPFADAVQTLKSVLQNRNESDDTRREAAFSLGAIGDNSSVSVLKANSAAEDPYLAEICKEALIKIGVKE